VAPIELVRSRLKGLSPDGRSARCPAHDDRRASLSIAEGDDGKVLLHCFANCDLEKIVSAMGLEMLDLWPSTNGKGERRIVAAYDYTDEKGGLLFQVVRFSPKDFRQRRPDPAAPDGWTWKLGDTRRVLYRLPELVTHTDQLVFIVEDHLAVALIGEEAPAANDTGGRGRVAACGRARFYVGRQIAGVSRAPHGRGSPVSM
jgi:hypothetical protein